MTRTPNYVVAYEATDQGADALELGIALAGLTGAELRICLVLPDLLPIGSRVSAGGDSYRTLLEQQGAEWLEAPLERIPAGVSATTHLLWSESTAGGLINAAVSFDSDRIVVGASRTGILRRFTVGSVANDLLHASPIPVALAPHGYRAPERITRVTCAIGTRPGWKALLDSMVAISEGLAVDLRFVTLVDLDTTSGRAVDHWAGTEHLESVLTYFRERSSATGSVDTEVAAGGSVEEAIDGLDWRDDELVFVGSSRLAQPNRIFLGATANRMLRALPVPLVVVPAAARPDGKNR